MKSVFDVAAFHFGNDNIQRYSTFPASRIEETVHRQSKLADLWHQDFTNMRARLSSDREALDDYKLRRVQLLVDHAFATTQFYRTHYGKVGYKLGDIYTWQDFEQLPLVSKEDLRNHFPDNVDPSLDHKKLYGVRTSGSSGKPVTIVMDDHRAERDTLMRIRQFEALAGKTLPEEGWLYNIHHSKWWFSSMLGKFPTFTLRQDCPIEDIISHLKLLKPAVISALPSTLTDLAKAGLNLNKLGTYCVSTNSESSTRVERDSLARAFGVPVGDEYSSEELGLIATECSCGQYHVVEDECHIEILRDSSDAKLGKVVGTDLWNMAMPIIRYDQGDIAESLQPSNCLCGCTFSLLRSFQGRSDQSFINAFGETVSASNLLDVCDEFFVPEASNISEFKLVQKTATHVVLLAVLSEPATPLDPMRIQAAKNKIRHFMGHDITFEIEQLEKIPQNLSYKRRMVVSEVRK